MVSSIDGLKSLINSRKARKPSQQEDGVPLNSNSHKKRRSGEFEESRASSSDYSRVEQNNSSAETSATKPIADLQSFLRLIGEPCRVFAESDEDLIKRYNTVRSDMRIDQKSVESTPSSRQMTPPAEICEWLQEALRVDSSDIILRWIATVFLRWKDELNGDLSGTWCPTDDLSDEIKLFMKTQNTLEPMIHALLSGQVDIELRKDLEAVVRFALAKQFADANNAYLRLSIGNKPWPIGVGHVFIQERASMDRIATSTHLMNNERVRGYVQSIKRLLTKASLFWDPSDKTQRPII